MSFGKFAGNGNGKSAQTVHASASFGDIRQSVKPAGKSNLPWIVGGAFLCMATFAAPFAWSYVSASSGRLPLDLAYLPKEPAPVARRLPLDERPKLAFTGLGMDIGIEFPANQTSTGFDPIDTYLYDRCIRPLSKREEAGSRNRRAVVLSVKNGQKFLVCSMSHQVSRFCEPSYRQRLAKRLRILIRAQEARAIAQAQMLANPMGRQMNEVFTEIQNEINAQVGTPDSTRRVTSGPETPLVGIGPELGARLREFSRTGLLTASDFGLAGIPSAVQPFIGRQEVHVCPNG